MKKLLLAIAFILSVVIALNLIVVIAQKTEIAIYHWNTREEREKLKVIEKIKEKADECALNNIYIKKIDNYEEYSREIVKELYIKDDKTLNIITSVEPNKDKTVIKEYQDLDFHIAIIEISDKITRIDKTKSFRESGIIDNMTFLSIKHHFLDNQITEEQILEDLKDCEITEEKYNGNEVYAIKGYYENELMGTTYIDKNTGLNLYSNTTVIVTDENGEEERSTETTEWSYKFGTVTDRDVAMPDLSEYTELIDTIEY